MLNTPAYILLTLYSVIIVACYFIVRRGWRRAYPTFVVGGIANMLVAFLFSLMRGNMLLQAIFVAPVTGLLFVAVSVLMASLFRDTMPSHSPKRSAMLLAANGNQILQAHSVHHFEQNDALLELCGVQESNSVNNPLTFQIVFDEPEVGELVALGNC
jgi:hypothetical protein